MMDSLSAKIVLDSLNSSVASINKCSCLDGRQIDIAGFEAQLLKSGADKKLARSIAQDLDKMDSTDGKALDGKFFPWVVVNKVAGGNEENPYFEATRNEGDSRSSVATYLQTKDMDSLICGISQELYQKWIDKNYKVDKSVCGQSAIDDYHKGVELFKGFRDAYAKISKPFDIDYYQKNFKNNSSIVDDLFEIAGVKKPFDYDMKAYLRADLDNSQQLSIAVYYRKEEDRKIFDDMVSKLKEKLGTENITGGRDSGSNPYLRINQAVFPKLFAELEKLYKK